MGSTPTSQSQFVKQTSHSSCQRLVKQSLLESKCLTSLWLKDLLVTTLEFCFAESRKKMLSAEWSLQNQDPSPLTQNSKQKFTPSQKKKVDATNHSLKDTSLSSTSVQQT